ncbi:hypothetical protein T265_13839, partial [Opisthorchis viverrini]
MLNEWFLLAAISAQPHASSDASLLVQATFARSGGELPLFGTNILYWAQRKCYWCRPFRHEDTGPYRGVGVCVPRRPIGLYWGVSSRHSQSLIAELMRKPLRALAYVILFVLLFGLINVILRHFRILTTFNPFRRSGDIVLLWDYGSMAINHKEKQFESFRDYLPRVQFRRRRGVVLSARSDHLVRRGSNPGGGGARTLEDQTLRADKMNKEFLPENTSLSSFIQLANRHQLVRNEDLFGRLPSPSHADLDAFPDSVFVIQVHSRLDNLRLLIASLERVKHIERSLLVFSSDLISNELISLVNGIRFARTVQIYFPHSIQAFPVGFPGEDCHGVACGNNKPGRDIYGHTRDGNLTQIKHHWLWKFQFVFKDLVAIKHFTGHVIFLEEDYYVVEDILAMRRLVEHVWSPTEQNGVIAFGARVPTATYHGNRTAIDYFISSQHNQGMGISRVMWKVISDCLSVFCEYDDYNWDWSLQELGRRCIKGGLRVLIFAWFSRVYHLGECLNWSSQDAEVGFEPRTLRSRNIPICKQTWFCKRLTGNPAESIVCDVSRQLNVLHQAASCFSCYDVRDIAIH